VAGVSVLFRYITRQPGSVFEPAGSRGSRLPSRAQLPMNVTHLCFVRRQEMGERRDRGAERTLRDTPACYGLQRIGVGFAGE
jgi:hypothetical protein